MALIRALTGSSGGGGCQVNHGTIADPANSGVFEVGFEPDVVIVSADRNNDDYTSYYIAPNSYIPKTYRSSSLGVLSGTYGYRTNLGGTITVSGTQATFAPNSTWTGVTMYWVAFKFA